MFQTGSVQRNAFQLGGVTVVVPSSAFQQDAFQQGAFQMYGGTYVSPATTVTSQTGGGWWKKKKPDKESAKLIWSLLPKSEKREIVIDAVKQALDAAPDAPQIDPAVAADALLMEQTLSELRRIKYAETLLARIERAIAEIDDEDAILLALH